MKLSAFSALAATAAIVFAQGAYAADQDGAQTAPQSAEQQAQADANAAKVKEGLSSAFSFLKRQATTAVNAASDVGDQVKAAGSKIADQAQGATQSQPAGSAAAAAPAASSNSLAQTAANASNSGVGRFVKGIASNFVPGGSRVVTAADQALNAKAKADASAAAASTAQASAAAKAQADSSVADNQPVTGIDGVPDAAPNKVADKVKARRASASAPATPSKAPGVKM